jgi:putative transposase
MHGVQSRRAMVEAKHKKLSITAQCKLLSVSHSGFYYVPAQESENNLSIMKAIDRIHTDYPFYGFRRIQIALKDYGIFVGKKLIIRLMKLMAIHTFYPKPRTTVRSSEHTVYPYLLRDLKIENVNQVWEMDITYIAMEKGFMYLAAVIDVYSRLVLSWKISNTMESVWCKEIVEEAIEKYGCPLIFNTDQGSQFTSAIFTTYLLEKHIQISMDGRGRATDNIYIERFWRSVKQEKIYLNAYQTGLELYAGLLDYVTFYNTKRPHQSLGYQCPEKFYKENLKIILKC